MEPITVYLIVSSILLAWVASVWSSKAGLNLFLKSIYTLAAIWGAGMAIVRLGWIA